MSLYSASVSAALNWFERFLLLKAVLAREMLNLLNLKPSKAYYLSFYIFFNDFGNFKLEKFQN